MPSIRKIIAATTGDALINSGPLNIIPAGGAILNLWIAGVTKTDTYSLSIGTRAIIVSANVNIEVSADVIDIKRDQQVFNEYVEAGQLTMPMTLTTEDQFLISIKNALGR